MLLCGTKRIQTIIALVSSLQYKMMSMQKKLTDLQQYSASIADGVSIQDLMESPASTFGRMSLFLVQSHQSALQGAQQNYAMMQASGSLQASFGQMDSTQQEAYKQLVFKNLYDQQKEKMQQVESKMLDAQETKIQQEISQIQTQISMLNEEKKNTESMVEQDAKNSAPKYA